MNKIKSGFFAVTEVNDPARHVEYNWWHSRDHQPENMAINGVILATRWAAPKRFVEARLNCHPALAGHQYLVHYLMEDPLDRVLRDFSDLGATTRAMGRFFGPRTIVLSGHFDLLKGYVSPRMEISPEALPFRPNSGVFVVMKDATGDQRKQQEVAQWYDRVHIPDLLTLPGMMGCYWFRTRPGAQTVGLPGIGDPANRHVWLYYLDDDPVKVLDALKAKGPEWRAAGRALDTSKSMNSILSAPYENIIDPRSYDVQKR